METEFSKCINKLLSTTDEKEKLELYSIISFRLTGIEKWLESFADVLYKYDKEETKIAVDLLKNLIG